MKQVIGLVLLGLLHCYAVLAEDDDGGAVQPRIVNGVEVDVADYKYALSVRVNGGHICGASIITTSHALSAGHCVYNYTMSVSSVTLYGGSSSPSDGGFEFPVLAIAVHPDFKRNLILSDFDVAVLTVEENAFSEKENIAPIELATSEMPVDTYCYVFGWGRTNYKLPGTADKLRYADMYIVSQESCVAAWKKYPAIVTPNMICAQYDNITGVDTCKGDSGGGLICDEKLTGIISFTNLYCNSAWPAGFTKLIAPSIREFIKSIAGI